MGKKIKINCSNCRKSIQKKLHFVKRNRFNFCSRKCYSEYRSKFYRNEWGSNWKGGEIKVVCSCCGEGLLRSKWHLKTYKYVFCSKKCRVVFLSKIFKQKGGSNWQGGKSFEEYSLAWTKELQYR